MTGLLRLFRDETASAAAEMALVLPLLLALMFGALEVGYYFMSEHVVQKAVRDAARYAARKPLVEADGTVNYSCSGPTLGTAVQTQIQEVARFQDPTGTADNATARLTGWTSDDKAAVSLSCITQSSGGSYVNNGVYANFPAGTDGKSGAIPVITVTATIPYATLFGTYVFGAASMNLYATSQAAVIGA